MIPSLLLALLLAAASPQESGTEHDIQPLLHEEGLRYEGLAIVVGHVSGVKHLQTNYPSRDELTSWAQVTLSVKEAIVGDYRAGDELTALGHNVLVAFSDGQAGHIEFHSIGFMFPGDDLVAVLVPTIEGSHSYIPEELNDAFVCTAFWLISKDGAGNAQLNKTRGVTYIGSAAAKYETDDDLYGVYVREDIEPVDELDLNVFKAHVTKLYAKAREN